MSARASAIAASWSQASEDIVAGILEGQLQELQGVGLVVDAEDRHPSQIWHAVAERPRGVGAWPRPAGHTHEAGATSSARGQPDRALHGRRTANSVPTPGSLATSIRPPCMRTSRVGDRQAKAGAADLPEGLPSNWVNCWKSRPRSSGLIPMPVSRTARRTARRARCRRPRRP